MPFKIHGTGAPGRKAAKNPRNPKNDAFQELLDMAPWTKGSKKSKKSKKRCLSRIMGEEPLDQRQQKAQEIALRPKAAKSPRNPKIDAFQELLDMAPRTKGSKKLKKF